MVIRRSALLALVALLLLVAPIMALVGYTATLSVTESNGTDYAMLGIQVTSNNDYMAANGYMKATALDTRVETLGGLAGPHLVTEDKTLAAVPVPADSQVNRYFTTGNSDLTSMDIITGHNGFVTITDDPALELGNNFAIELDGYVDTTGGADTNLVIKQNSFRTYIDGATNITSELSTGYDSDQLGLSTFSDISNGLAIQRSGQSITAFPAATILSIQLNLSKVGAPTGNAFCRVWDTTNPPNILGTLGVIDVATLGAGPAYFTFDTTPVAVAAGTVVIGLEYNGGSAANYVRLGADSTNPKAGENLVTATLAGNWATTATHDLTYQNLTYLVLTEVTAVGVASGEHVIQTTADGVNLKIFVDTVEEDTVALAGATAYPNANNWILGQTNTLPYYDYYKHTVSGVLIAWYQPVTIIAGTVLPDRAGAVQNGAITWGANPAGIAVAMGEMVADSQPSAGAGTVEESLDILPTVAVSDWFVEPAVGVGGALLTNPVRPFVTMMSDNSTITELQAWRFLGFAIVLLVTVVTAWGVRGHYLITGIVCGAAILGMVVLTVFPMWALVFMAFAVVAGLVAERSPTI